MSAGSQDPEQWGFSLKVPSVCVCDNFLKSLFFPCTAILQGQMLISSLPCYNDQPSEFVCAGKVLLP